MARKIGKLTQIIGQKARRKGDQANEHEKQDVQPDARLIYLKIVMMIVVCVDPIGPNDHES